MMITKIALILVLQIVNPLFCAAFKTEIECFAKMISSLDPFLSIFQALITLATESFIFQIVPSRLLSTITDNFLFAIGDLYRILFKLMIWTCLIFLGDDFASSFHLTIQN